MSKRKWGLTNESDKEDVPEIGRGTDKSIEDVHPESNLYEEGVRVGERVIS